jgi:DNA-binding transcriptional regulator YiaG
MSSLALIAPQNSLKGLEVKSSSNLKLHTSFTSQLTKKVSDFLMVLTADFLSSNKDLVEEAIKQKSFRGLILIESMNNIQIAQILIAELLEKGRFKNFHEKFVPIIENRDVLERIVWAWEIGSATDIIADAFISNNELVIRSCSFELFRVPVKSIKALKGLKSKDYNNFEIDEDGSYVYWKSVDKHIDLDVIKAAADPSYSKKLKTEGLKKSKQFGNALKLLRKEVGLNQNDFQGISSKTIARYENGEASPTHKSLELIAKGMNMKFDDFYEALGAYLKVSN